MTIPPETLRQADLLARRLDRSRSWVIAEAIRRFGGAAEVAASIPAVAEPRPTAGFADAAAVARREHLRHAISLSPAERLQRADALVALGRAVRPPTNRRQIVAFASLEDFATWKKGRRAGG